MEVDIQENGQEKSETKLEELSPKLIDIPESNGKGNKEKSTTPEHRMTRSRSKTPQKKRPAKKSSPIIKEEMEKKTIVEEAVTKVVAETETKSPEKTKEQSPTPNENLNGNIEEELKVKEVEKAGKETTDMEPLVLNGDDEPDPELQFDENSDLDSLNSSPLPSRCKTRRSQTRNIPTPKTPKCVDIEHETEKNLETASSGGGGGGGGSSSSSSTNILDRTYESTLDLNLSTKAEAGDDSTRLNFHTDDSLSESYLESYRNRSLRGLSARRSIRPGNEVYLKRAIRNNHEKSELNSSSVGGVKRKNRSETPEDRKKIKTDSSSSLFSLMSSPFSMIKNKFNPDFPMSSTPKLTAYKDENGLSYGEDKIEVENGMADKKNWCSVM